MDTLVTGGRVHVCYGKLLLQVPLRQSSYPSYLWLLWQHGRTQILRTADIRHGRGQSAGDQVTCDNWALTGQEGGYSYPGDHPNPLPPPLPQPSRADNLLSPPGELCLSQAVLAQPGLANEILIFSSAHICRRYLWFLSKKAAQSSVIRPQLKVENNGVEWRESGPMCAQQWGLN